MCFIAIFNYPIFIIGITLNAVIKIFGNKLNLLLF